MNLASLVTSAHYRLSSGIRVCSSVSMAATRALLVSGPRAAWE